MEVIELKSSQEFLDHLQEKLLKHESLNNLILGLAFELKGEPGDVSNHSFFAFKKNQKFIGGALRTDKERPLVISPLEKEDSEAFAYYLKSKNMKIHEIHAEKITAETFANSFCSHKDIVMSQGVYELSNLIAPKQNLDVSFKIASIKDLETACELICSFSNECTKAQKVPEDFIEVAKKHIQNKNLLLLKYKDEIVSCACQNRQTINTGSVSLVYTKKKYRGLGFGSLICAKATELVFKRDKKLSNLFTDLSNPTSNNIYKKIGYKMIGQSVHYRFEHG